MAISGVNQTTTTATTAANQQARTDLGQKDIFLKLLVAQMKFQDPLKPQDPTQMASQLAQFNMVEQQTSTNTLLKELVARGGSTGSSNNDVSATWLGHTVTVNQSKVHFDGVAPQSFNVNLPADAGIGFLTISDATGNPVRTAQIGGMTAGVNPFNWDGSMDNGATAPAGDYSITVSASDMSGTPMTPTVSRSGIVEAVRFTTTGNELVVGGIAAATADITEIRP
ncbi:MAG: flagellar hook capping protein [Zetaproteobacteria bacterium CG06_land_8_20_14_3_00_59_53]|nr:MAG: flagellar hook capping protein [Zetaproteobacteria bacterium CG2_30_59_37]PIO88710.1 MAG: flagellar hook capping protein [Zetaproteobacteria bacterium CG23_combo_of_CG06-09_8_20_14_all_59_86]PIQ65384.1 MAG: flagellar hook capping protein [Zetaproteobacteria bacterium CG11_big_fil_rev_8_21_14_0_20_59_439]PIU69636.1 MAG: flagellar hook capping protein [Zetaproteobacteria bacterium CG06_land_8_20_14_3_00_59_53]PIU96883.1 MAG: flagellar hook capping protein [Zetaproteobacteria bacterium CG0